MDKLFQQLIESCFQAVYGEGRRLVRIQALSLVLEVIQGVRRAVLLQYVLICACLLWTLAFFASGLLVATNWTLVRAGEWPVPLLFSVAVLFLVTLVLSLTVSQRAWIRALGISKRVSELSEPESQARARDGGTASGPSASGLSEADLSRLIERAVDRALEKRAG